MNDRADSANVCPVKHKSRFACAKKRRQVLGFNAPEQAVHDHHHGSSENLKIAHSGTPTNLMSDVGKLEARWMRIPCVHRLESDEAAAMFSRIASQWRTPERWYHTLGHLTACLEQLDQYVATNSPPEERDEIEMALWFHDAIYDSTQTDSEQRSADFADELLKPLILDRDRIRELILATDHRRGQDNTDHSTCLIVDIDLHVLGSTRATYDTYRRNVRREYAWVTDPDYAEGRAKVLESFLKQRTIYRLPWFQEQFEAPARENLEWELDQL